MLTKRTIEDKIEIIGLDRVIQIRDVTIIEENGAELSRSNHRRTICLGDDIAGETDLIKRIYAAIHA